MSLIVIAFILALPQPARAALTFTDTGITSDSSLTLNPATSLIQGGAVGDILSFTGTVSGASPLIFEGLTADAFETTFALTDPTADRTITLPDATTTLVGRDTTDTLTNKTLTSPTIGTSPTAAGATWTDLGTVTTVDINGGTLDGVTIGAGLTGIGSNGAISGTMIFATTGFTPDANDGAYLGLPGNAFSDLALASGGVINFDAGDVTMTHASNALAFAGASTGYTFDSVLTATNSAAASSTSRFGSSGMTTISSSLANPVVSQSGYAAGSFNILTFSGSASSTGSFGTSSEQSGVEGGINWNSSGTATELNGGSFLVVTQNIAHGLLAKMTGASTFVSHSGQGTITNALGFNSIVYLGGNGNIDNAHGVNIQVLDAGGTGRIDSAKGIYIEPFGVGFTSNVGLDIGAITGTGAKAIQTSEGTVDFNWNLAGSSTERIGVDTDLNLASGNQSAAVYGGQFGIDWNSTGSASGRLVGIDSRVNIANVNHQTLDSAYGATVALSHIGQGTLTNAYGVNVDITGQNTGTTENTFGLNVFVGDSFSNHNHVSVTGVNIQDMGVGSASNTGLAIGAITGAGAASIRQASGAIMNWGSGSALLTHSASNDRLEFSGADGGLWVEDKFSLGVQTHTIADNGGPTAASSTTVAVPITSSFVEIVCNDAHGCEYSISEVGAREGDTVTFISISTVTVSFADVSDVQNIGGGATMLGQYDTATFIYSDSVSAQWVMVSKSDN